MFTPKSLSYLNNGTERTIARCQSIIQRMELKHPRPTLLELREKYNLIEFV